MRSPRRKVGTRRGFLVFTLRIIRLAPGRAQHGQDLVGRSFTCMLRCSPQRSSSVLVIGCFPLLALPLRQRGKLRIMRSREVGSEH